MVNDIKRSNFKTGAGVGVRWASPVGPIKFDLAAPVGDNETKNIQFYIGLGQNSDEMAEVSEMAGNHSAGSHSADWRHTRLDPGTQSGLHFALNLAPRVVSGLAIGQVEGDLRNLTLKQVKYTMPGIDVSVDKVNLALRLSCLKDMTLCVENLSTDGTRVAVDTAKLPPSEETPPSEPLTELNAPLTIFPDSLCDQHTGHRG